MLGTPSQTTRKTASEIEENSGCFKVMFCQKEKSMMKLLLIKANIKTQVKNN